MNHKIQKLLEENRQFKSSIQNKTDEIDEADFRDYLARREELLEAFVLEGFVSNFKGENIAGMVSRYDFPLTRSKKNLFNPSTWLKSTSRRAEIRMEKDFIEYAKANGISIAKFYTADNPY